MSYFCQEVPGSFRPNINYYRLIDGSFDWPEPKDTIKAWITHLNPGEEMKEKGGDTIAELEKVKEMIGKIEQNIEKPSPKQRFKDSVKRGKNRLPEAFDSLKEEDQEKLLSFIDRYFK